MYKVLIENPEMLKNIGKYLLAIFLILGPEGFKMLDIDAPALAPGGGPGQQGG